MAKKASASASTTKTFLTQLAKVNASADALYTNLAALGLPVLTDEERTHTGGKLRVNENAAITCVLDTVDAFPALFGSLAAQDGGTDPNAVETQPSRDALAKNVALAPLLPLLAKMQTMVADGVFANGDLAKQLSVPAYAIGKVIASSNPKVRTSLAPAITFYGSAGLKRAAKNVRTANQTKRAAKRSKTAST